jgi:Predicted methyltransferase regulatory domain
MADWTDGYVAGIDYTHGYYAELNPLRLTAPLLNVGILPPVVETACELGFGQGVSVNIHAAAANAVWYGTDFNPTHTAFAQSLAQVSGAVAHLFDQSFAEFCERPDLPDFDYIGLHGVWSWISEENQQVIVDFIRRKLKVGGAVYISYNVQPGFSAMIPLRHLLIEHAEAMSGSGRGIVARIDAAIDFADRLVALNPAFAVVNPTIGQRLAAVKPMSRSYLAHEYFNRDWRPLHFDQMATQLMPAKLSYAGSAHYLDHVEALNLTPDQQRFLAEIPDPIFRQLVRDFVVNQQFRRDYWVKGARRLLPLEQAEAIRRVRVTLITPASDVSLTVASAFGQREMTAGVYGPILDALAAHPVRTVGELEHAFDPSGARLSIAYEALLVLIGKGDVALIQDDAARDTAAARTVRLNQRIIERARSSGDLLFLASPVLGAGVSISRFDQLFLLALQHGRGTADDQAQFAWDILRPQGQRVIKDNKPLETSDENLSELGLQAAQFIDKRLAILKALQVA